MIQYSIRKAVRVLTVLMAVIILVSAFSTVAYASGMCGVVLTEVLNIRTQPNTDCPIAGQYTYGKVVDIIGIEGAWYKVKHNGEDAYLISDYVKVVDYAEASRYAEERTKGSRVVDISRQYLGTPYVYGGTSPSGFDCSGLAKYCYAQLGVTLKRTAASQATQGTFVNKADLIPGDLVFFITDGYSISHVGIYAGDGMMVHAPRPGKRVELVTIESGYYASTYTTARRIFD